MADRPYIFFELTNSLCSTCLCMVESKVIFQEEWVHLVKHCPEHKQEKFLISTDVDYYQFSRRALEPGTMPRNFNTTIERGCLYDCRLCPDHEQHSCLALVDATEARR
jgi:7,8-dihydro-6-hydroxymethylpterin dimethyltransferase